MEGRPGRRADAGDGIDAKWIWNVINSPWTPRQDNRQQVPAK